MERTLQCIINKISRHIPKKILSEEWLQHINKISNCFPSKITKQMIFESNMCDTRTKTDFAFYIDKHDITQLINHCNNKKYRHLFDSCYWTQLIDFCKHWNKKETPFNTYMDYMWLEFDIHDNIPDKPEFLMFFHINKQFYQQNSPPINWLTDRLQTISQNRLPDNLYANLHQCFTHLYNNIKIKYIGFMPSRSGNTVRVCITDLNREEIFQYLTRIGLTNNFSSLKKVLTDLDKYLFSYVLHIDIDESIQPVAGIELQLKRPFTERHKWQPIFDYLLKNNFIYREKCEALYDWGVKTREFDIPELQNYYSYVYLYYIKAVYRLKKPLTFKGYLANVNMPVT